MRFLFWNTHNNDSINNVLTEVIVENRVDVVVLAEYTANLNDLCFRLDLQGIRMWQYPAGVNNRLTIIGSPINVSAETQTPYESIQFINDDLILCCIHLPSKIYTKGSQTRRAATHRIVEDIKGLEKKRNTKNTVVVGDFNVNPYEKECMGFEYFYGIPYIDKGRTSREIAEVEYEFFYNPMWNFLGDFQEPYGTYYSSGSDTYWNILDQVIIRPSLKSRFKNDALRIVVRTANTILINSNGHPNKRISDHLPIVFEVEDNCEQI